MQARSRLAAIAVVAATAVVPMAATTPTTAVAATAHVQVGSHVRATGNVFVRSGAGTHYKRLGVLRRGTVVTVNGAARGAWQPISYHGRTGWVSTRHLSGSVVSATSAAKTTTARRSSTISSNVTMPSGVTANAMAVANAVVANFPQITTMGGYRNEAGSDHSTGKAVDIMLPDYKNNVALGNTIAAYMRAHASELHISYVIWNQHIWSVQRASEGWRVMANRGSDNANHKNHVHVSVK